MVSSDGGNPRPLPDSIRTEPNHTDATTPLTTATVEQFLAGIASRERSQSRLSVAALTAACCAAQLEAQCREALLYRRQAPGPRDIAPLIAGLQRARTRLGALIHEAVAMESASMLTEVLPHSSLEERLRRQVAIESMLTEFVVAGISAASLIVDIGGLARRVRALRREIRGGSPSEEALLAAASTAVLDVIERALRMSHARDPELRRDGFRAISRLRGLCLIGSLDGEERVRCTVRIEDRARWN